MELTPPTKTTGMRRSYATGRAREDDVVGNLALFAEYGGHDVLRPLDRSLRDGRPLCFLCSLRPHVHRNSVSMKSVVAHPDPFSFLLDTFSSHFFIPIPPSLDFLALVIMEQHPDARRIADEYCHPHVRRRVCEYHDAGGRELVTCHQCVVVAS
jgi:hypothetical protein